MAGVRISKRNGGIRAAVVPDSRVRKLWKFGFPEVVLFVHSALFNQVRSLESRCADLLNGVGCLLHHSAGSLLVCLLANGLPHRPWQPRFMLMAALIAVTQHMLSPLHYASPNVYLVLVLFLEALAEWCILSDLENIYKAHWAYAVLSCVMLFAHWMYLLAGLLDLVPARRQNKQEHTKSSILHDSTSGKTIGNSTFPLEI